MCIAIILGQCSQFAAIAALGLQFAIASSGDAKRTEVSSNATNLKRQFTSLQGHRIQ
jgi:hypothetical protein